jgi:hypothetical protein
VALRLAQACSLAVESRASPPVPPPEDSVQ